MPSVPAACDTVSESGAVTRMPGGGFLNLRQYEEEVNKLRKDNLSLRLRIYLLEERHGLLPKARQDNTCTVLGPIHKEIF